VGRRPLPSRLHISPPFLPFNLDSPPPCTRHPFTIISSVTLRCREISWADAGLPDEVLNSPRLLNLPLLLLANKQDNPTSLSVQEIRESFDAWYRAGLSKHHSDDEHDQASRTNNQEREGQERRAEDRWDDGGAKEERMASLDVMGVSALEG